MCDEDGDVYSFGDRGEFVLKASNTSTRNTRNTARNTYRTVLCTEHLNMYITVEAYLYKKCSC